MEQRLFNNSLDKVIKEIRNKYYYNDEAFDLEGFVYDSVYDQLEFNFTEFERAEISYSEASRSSLTLTVYLYDEEGIELQKITTDIYFE